MGRKGGAVEGAGILEWNRNMTFGTYGGTYNSTHYARTEYCSKYQLVLTTVLRPPTFLTPMWFGTYSTTAAVQSYSTRVIYCNHCHDHTSTWHVT